jgi:hypothetical protein
VNHSFVVLALVARSAQTAGRRPLAKTWIAATRAAMTGGWRTATAPAVILALVARIRDDV